MSVNTMKTPEELRKLDPMRVYLLLLEDETIQKELDVLSPLVDTALAAYGVPSSNVEWALAETDDEAMAWLTHLDSLGQGERGFDAVFCDMRIQRGASASYEAGLNVALEAARRGWPAWVVGYTYFVGDLELRRLKQAAQERIGSAGVPGLPFDDFLSKQDA